MQIQHYHKNIDERLNLFVVGNIEGTWHCFVSVPVDIWSFLSISVDGWGHVLFTEIYKMFNLGFYMNNDFQLVWLISRLKPLLMGGLNDNIFLIHWIIIDHVPL